MLEGLLNSGLQVCVQDEAGRSFFVLPQLAQVLKRTSEAAQLFNLAKVLRQHDSSREELPIAVFVNSEKRCEEVAKALREGGPGQEGGIIATALTRPAQEGAEGLVRAGGPAQVIVTCSDVLFELGVHDLACVINLELPQDLGEYMRRLGLLQRSGTMGAMTSFFTDEVSVVMDIKLFIHQCLGATGDLKIEWSRTDCSRLEELGPWATLRVRDELAFVRCVAVPCGPRALGPGSLDAFCGLPALAELDLSGCDTLRELPERIGQLSGTLRVLRLPRCSALAALPAGLCELRELRTLDLAGCSSLKALPEALGSGLSRSLEELDLRNCCSLPRLPDSVCELGQLRRLDIGGCSSLNTLPADIGQLSSLTSLHMFSCPLLTQLPESVTALTQLRRLDVRGTPLSSLPKGVDEIAAAQPCQPVRDWQPWGLKETAWYGGI